VTVRPPPPPPGVPTPVDVLPPSITTISSYSDLVQKCQDWLFGRADLANQVPTFIQMFEAKANRKLFCRQMENRAVTTINLTEVAPEFVDLPIGFQSMRRVRVINTTSKPRLKFLTGQQMDDTRERAKTPGTPVWFAIFGQEMELCPTPNLAYQIEMVYRAYLSPLGIVPVTPSPPIVVPGTPANLTPVATNWLLQTAPDLYLYGTLMEAAPYLYDDERIPVWAAGVQAGFADLNALSLEASYNAGPLAWRRKGSSYS
jgi:hypothetical protein